MSMATGQISNPRQWQSKIPKGLKAGYQQQFGPEQMQQFQSQFAHIGPDSFLSQLAGGDEGAFQQMEEPAWRAFSAAQGQLGSRFSGMGQGAQKSSGFRNTAGQLGADFASDLASKRADYRRQALHDLMGFSNQILNQRPFEQFVSKKAPSNFEKFLNYYVPTVQSVVGGGSKMAGGGF